MKEYIGGLRWGSGLLCQMNFSYPFAKLIVEGSHIILRAPNIEIHLERNEIVEISIKNRLFYKGIVFRHSNNGAPKTLIFWTFQAPDVLKAVNEFVLSK